MHPAAGRHRPRHGPELPALILLLACSAPRDTEAPGDSAPPDDSTAASADTAFVPGTATGSIIRNDEVRVNMAGGAWTVDPRATFDLRLASATVDCDYDTWSDTLRTPWTRVSCPAEGGVASIQHAENDAWTEVEAYNLANCTVEHTVADGRVIGRLLLVDAEDGSDRGEVSFDVPDCG